MRLDPYAILRVPHDTSGPCIKAAYNELMRELNNSGKPGDASYDLARFEVEVPYRFFQSEELKETYDRS